MNIVPARFTVGIDNYFWMCEDITWIQVRCQIKLNDNYVRQWKTKISPVLNQLQDHNEDHMTWANFLEISNAQDCVVHKVLQTSLLIKKARLISVFVQPIKFRSRHQLNFFLCELISIFIDKPWSTQNITQSLANRYWHFGAEDTPTFVI